MRSTVSLALLAFLSAFCTGQQHQHVALQICHQVPSLRDIEDVRKELHRVGLLIHFPPKLVAVVITNNLITVITMVYVVVQLHKKAAHRTWKVCGRDWLSYWWSPLVYGGWASVEQEGYKHLVHALNYWLSISCFFIVLWIKALQSRRGVCGSLKPSYVSSNLHLRLELRTAWERALVEVGILVALSCRTRFCLLVLLLGGELIVRFRDRRKWSSLTAEEKNLRTMILTLLEMKTRVTLPFHIAWSEACKTTYGTKDSLGPG